MPFTLAHPAIIVPLHRRLRRWTILSALVIGSIAPDFSYFIPLGIGRYETHTVAALFWYCLPMGLLFYFLYHKALLPVFTIIAPTTLQQRLNTLTLGKPPSRPFIIVLLCLLIGAASHIAWDYFTHYPHGVATAIVDEMTYVVARFNGYTLHVYRLLQHVSTLLGLGFIIYWLRGWYINTSPAESHIWMPTKPTQQLFRLTYFVIPIGSGIFAGYLSADYLISNDYGSTLYKSIMALRDIIIYGGQALLLTWSILGVCYLVLRYLSTKTN